MASELKRNSLLVAENLAMPGAGDSLRNMTLPAQSISAEDMQGALRGEPTAPEAARVLARIAGLRRVVALDK